MTQDPPVPTTEQQPQPKPEIKPDPVIEAFRSELLSILGNPLSAKTLNQAMQVADAARTLLAVRNPRNRLKNRGPRGFGQMNSNYVGGSSISMQGYGSDPYPYDDEEEDGDVMGPQATVGYNADGPGRMNVDRETFAARVLREIVGLIPQVMRASREDPAEIVKALAAAETLGMHELAKELRARLIPTPASEPAEEKNVKLSVRFPGTHYATKAPGSDEYIAGPGPISLVNSLKRPEHEVIDTKSGDIVIPAEPAPASVTGLEKVPVLDSPGGRVAVALASEIGIGPGADDEEEEEEAASC